MANTVIPDVKALLAFIPCDRHANTRSAEVWAANDGALILSFCQHCADKHAMPMWTQGFRPIMKAPVS